MAIKVGINGFGRMGRLLLRNAWAFPELEFIRINEPASGAECLAHLLNFDSVHGRWDMPIDWTEGALQIGDSKIELSAERSIEVCDWSACDLVVDASGQFKSQQALAPYFDQGVERVLVTAPVKEPEVLNIVMGVNQQLYRPDQHKIVTAASCTTNCLAPLVKVLQEGIGIARGSFTTIHDITNTQSILDTPHKDLRRARASSMSLIPTTTGSATAIMEIYPELKGRLDGHAVRVPLANASLTDCAFELQRDSSIEEINALFAAAAVGNLQGILGYEERPLVSVDYRSDPRSSIVDALSTRVIDGSHLKLYAWYDNEWAYAVRCAEIAQMIANAAP